MSRSDSRLKPWFARCLYIATAVTIPACSTQSTKPSVDRHLIELACPETFAPLTDDSFGATSVKLIEVLGQYWKCRAAALAKAE